MKTAKAIPYKSRSSVPTTNLVQEVATSAKSSPTTPLEAEHRRKIQRLIEDASDWSEAKRHGVDAKEEKRIVGIKAKPAFKPIFDLAETIEGSGITLLKDDGKGKASETSSDATETISCLWWRRGRVELPVQKTTSRIYYRLSRNF